MPDENVAAIPSRAGSVAVSVLFADPSRGLGEEAPAPACFRDLNLDQIVAAAMAPKPDYHLVPIFHTALADIEDIRYRQAVFRDAERLEVRAALDAFAEGMQALRANRAQIDKVRYKLEQQAWFLDGVLLYDAAVRGFVEAFTAVELHSAGLGAFRDYLAAYAGSSRFTALAAAAAGLKRDLAAISYCVYLIGSHVHVAPQKSQPDFAEEVLDVFSKFKQADAKDHSVKLPDRGAMNHIEASILDLVAQLYPETFSRLDAFATVEADFMDTTIATFDREVQFYLAWLDHIAPVRRRGLPFCYPEVSDGKAVHGEAVFDVALAHKLAGQGDTVVTNDFALAGSERIVVVTGPNQGGKTTFARMLGQLHYLAGLGCPVPGRSATPHLCDRIFTHFERPEIATSERSKLEDDLLRMRDILGLATPASLVILNEIFTSTTLADAVWLSREVMTRLVDLDVLAVWVTFIDELASFGDTVVSMVGGVDPRDTALRTFQLERRPADGLAYAMALAERHRLTYRILKERIP